MTSPDRPAHGIDGRRAWVIAVASAVAVGLGFGTAYSFGTFFGEMADDLGAGRGGTATVFGITIFLFFGFGVVSGRLSDRYGPRRLLVAAALLMSAGLLLTSRVHSLWAGFLTYGIGVGIGAGLYITPLFAVVGGWFDRSRAVGLGVVSAGSGLGTLLVNPTANRLIEAHGWRTTYVVLGRRRSRRAAGGVHHRGAATDRRLPHRAAATSRPPRTPCPFRLLFASALLMSVALFVAFAFVVPFAEDEGVSAGAASLLVGIIGAASVAGRLVLSVLTNRVGPLRLYKGCLVVQPIAYVVWLGVRRPVRDARRLRRDPRRVVRRLRGARSHRGRRAVRGGRPRWPARPAVPRRGHRRSRRTAAGRRPGRRHRRPARSPSASRCSSRSPAPSSPWPSPRASRSAQDDVDVALTQT